VTFTGSYDHPVLGRRGDIERDDEDADRIRLTVGAAEAAHDLAVRFGYVTLWGSAVAGLLGLTGLTMRPLGVLGGSWLMWLTVHGVFMVVVWACHVMSRAHYAESRQLCHTAHQTWCARCSASGRRV
jgi:hypothetical protein